MFNLFIELPILYNTDSGYRAAQPSPAQPDTQHNTEKYLTRVNVFANAVYSLDSNQEEHRISDLAIVSSTHHAVVVRSCSNVKLCLNVVC